jgi:hypothetical protein
MMWEMAGGVVFTGSGVLGLWHCILLWFSDTHYGKAIILLIKVVI